MNSRIHTVPKKYRFFISEYWNVLLTEINEPTTHDESLNSLESDKWLEAMNLEMDSM